MRRLRFYCSPFPVRGSIMRGREFRNDSFCIRVHRWGKVRRLFLAGYKSRHYSDSDVKNTTRFLWVCGNKWSDVWSCRRDNFVGGIVENFNEYTGPNITIIVSKPWKCAPRIYACVSRNTRLLKKSFCFRKSVQPYTNRVDFQIYEIRVTRTGNKKTLLVFFVNFFYFFF